MISSRRVFSWTGRFPGLSMLCGMVLLAGIATPAIAQAPLREICDQPDSGDRIKCKFGNIIEQQRGAADLLTTMGMLPPQQQEALTKQVERAGRAQGRADAMQFRQMTRKPQVTCQIKELLGDGRGDDDGICTAGEDCEEVIGDQIGNDDGECKPRNGNNREVCVEICDADAINSNPDNFDDDPMIDSLGRDIEESLDDLTDQYESINTMMLGQPSFQQSLAPSLATATGNCAAVIRQRPSSVLVAVMVGATEGARVAADVGERFCDQAAFGFSGSSVCAVVEGIAGAAKIISTAYVFEGADIDSTTIDSVFSCLKETSVATSAAVGAVADVSGDLSAVTQTVNLVDQRVSVLDQKVNTLATNVEVVQQTLAQIIIILNTPLGQRSEFPTVEP